MKSIIVRFPNWLGDAVMATPIIEGIQTLYPSTEIHVAGTDAICTLLEGLPIHSFIRMPNNSKDRSKYRKTLIKELKSRSFNSGLLLTRSFSSAWEFFRAGIPIRIGFSDHFRSPLLTQAIPLPDDEEHEHAVITYQRLLEGLSRIHEPILILSENEKNQARQSLESWDITPHHILIGINPGAAYGSAKCWPKENFRRVTEELLKDPQVRVLYFGDKNSKPLIDEICSRLPPKVVNLSGKTSLRELMAFMSHTKVVLTNDSGPMHLASALQIPNVALFGSTNAIKTGPWCFGHVVQYKVACSPCYLRKCPIDFRCMYGITVEMVLEKLWKLKNDSRN